MSKRDKRLDRMRANPRDWRIDDVASLCAAYDIHCGPPTGGGSHYHVSHPDQPQILTIPARRPIKPIYIRRLVEFIDRVQLARAKGE